MTEEPGRTQYFEKGNEKALTPEDHEEIKAATNVMKNFATAEKIYRLFPPTNVNVREAVGHFTSSLTLFFNKYHKPMSLNVTQESFLYRGQPIYTNAEKDKSLSFRVYIDGVRGITLNPGCEDKEARELMNVYLELSLVDPLENDFVSLFWERELQFVTIATTDVFQDEGEDADSPLTYHDFQSVVPGVASLGNSYSEEVSRIEHRKASMARERSDQEMQIIRSRADVFKFNADEKLTIQKYVEAETAYDSVFDFIETVFILFGISRDPALFSDIVMVIGRTIEGFVLRYQFDEAGRLLQRIRELAAGTESELNEIQKDSVRKMIRGLSNEKLMHAVNEHIRNADEALVGPAFKFLGNLESSILPDIFDLIKIDKYSDRVQKLFIELGRDQFDFFKNRIDDYGSDIAVVLLDILAGLDMQRSISLFVERMNSADAKIRSKCIKILLKHDLPELKEAFRITVTDANESNQLIALRYYNNHSYPDVFPVLAGLFGRKDFPDEKRDKQQLIIGAMIKADVSRSFDLIANVLKKKPILNRKRFLKFQKEIVKTLSGLDAIEVAELLLMLFEDKGLPADLKDQCKVAISSIRSRTFIQ